MILPDTTEASAPTTAPPLTAKPDDLAYVIFTSGSTGRPKGVGVPHSAIVNRLAWMADAYDVTAKDVIVHKTPFGFDVSVWELILPLLTGATMALARPEGHLDPTYLAQLIHDENASIIHFVPPMLDAFIALSPAHQCLSLRAVMASGQALTGATRDRFFDYLPHAELHNLYGPTEAAVDVTAHHCQRGERGNNVPIGKAISNVQLYVLDDAQAPVPAGVTGHLYIGGVALARGYVNRPDLTDAAFTMTPTGTRIYRTGDLARYLPDGALSYVGRADDQLKIRGFRIEPAEVEAALLAAGALEAVVMGRPNVGGEMQLMAWITGGPLIEAILVQRLPAYMHPATVMVLDALPLTNSGKVDRGALPDPEIEDRRFVAPQGDIEIRIAAIWAAHLGQPEIDAEASFFSMGGHSISALKVMAAIQREFDVVVSLRSFLAAPSVAGLAAAVDAVLTFNTIADSDDADTETLLL